MRRNSILLLASLILAAVPAGCSHTRNTGCSSGACGLSPGAYKTSTSPYQYNTYSEPPKTSHGLGGMFEGSGTR